MSDPIYCPAQTFAGSINYGPPEYCMTEVADYGDLCPIHDADARAEDDYDRYLQQRED